MVLWVVYVKPISFLTVNTLIKNYSQQTTVSVNKTVQLSPWEMIFSEIHLWCREILLLIPYPTFRQMTLADASFCTINPLFIKYFSKGVPREEKAIGSGQHFTYFLYPCNSFSSLLLLQVSSTTAVPNFPTSTHVSACQQSKPQPVFWPDQSSAWADWQAHVTWDDWPASAFKQHGRYPSSKYSLSPLHSYL